MEKPQGYVIELYFDKMMEEQILAFRESIYRLGVNPVLGKLEDRPHVSLAVFGEEDPQKLIQITSFFAKEVTRFPVELAAVGMFPTSANVIYLQPVPSIQLVTMHKVFCQILKKENFDPSSYYLPDRWIPHCTLEYELSDAQFDLAFRLCKKHFSPIDGHFESLGVLAFRPIEYLAEFKLSIED